jgi:excisionase family DNA binding protein
MNDVLTEIEAAELLDCEPATVQEKARLGKLPAVKYGRSWRIPRSALMESLHNEAMANMARSAAPAKARATSKASAPRRAPPALPAL